MRILSVVNQKGGCGKTTVSINLAAALAKRKKDVLLIDMDPQGHASIGLNIDPEDYERSTYDVLMHADVEIDQVVVPVVEHLDVCPASVVLAARPLGEATPAASRAAAGTAARSRPGWSRTLRPRRWEARRCTT